MLRCPQRLLTRLRGRLRPAERERDRRSWRWLRWPLIALLGLALILLLLWALIAVPALILGVDQVQEVRQLSDHAKRLDAVNGLRSTLAGVLGGLAVAVGAIVAALNFRETSRQNRVTFELQHRGQVTERFTKAIDQLGQTGKGKLDVRIGAVYALEQIAQDSPELHWPIMEVLTAYLREHVPLRYVSPSSADDPPQPPAADSQAVATVLGRRHAEHDADQQLNMYQVSLGGVNLSGANLGGANLSGANLRWADLRGAYLGETTMVQTDLTHALLKRANLERADLRWANLRGADLDETDLRGADLGGANLDGTRLSDALMGDARLLQTTLHNTFGLTAEQLRSSSSIEGAKLPPELAHQAGEPTPEPGSEAAEGPTAEQR